MGEQIEIKYLDKYKTTMPEVFSSIFMAVGAQVQVMILEKAIKNVKYFYPEADKIRISENEIDFDGLYELEDERAKRILKEFHISILDTLSSLIGSQIALKLTDKLFSETIVEGGI